MKTVILWRIYNRNFILILTAVIIFSTCTRTKEKITDSDIKQALEYLVDSSLIPLHRGNILLGPNFIFELSESNLKQFVDIDSIMSEENLIYMEAQLTENNYKSIRYYLNAHSDKITNREPIKEFYYEFSPPLFTKNKMAYFVYIKAYFKVDDKIRWDEIAYIFYKYENYWKLKNVVKIKRAN